MVMILRCWKVKQTLQNHMDGCGAFKILAADNIRDALRCVIDHHGKMIGCSHIPPRQDDIADSVNKLGRVDLNGCAVVCIGDWRLINFKRRNSRCHIKTKHRVRRHVIRDAAVMGWWHVAKAGIDHAIRSQ